MMILDVQDLKVAFPNADKGSFTAVNNLSFGLNKGEILGIIGESGSGKSVATQAITGLIQGVELSGSCIFNDRGNAIDLIKADSKTLRRIRRNDIAYIFQEPMTALNPLLTCGEQIRESLSPKLKAKEKLNKVNKLLEKVELSDVKRIYKSYPHELSGGQRQRIMIAMALAKSPALLIADEPTTALDVAVQSEVMSLLKRLASVDGLAIVFITHDLISLKNFADKIVVMYRGTSVEYGDSPDVLQSPRHNYTKALLDSRATFDKRGSKLLEISDILEGVKSEPKLPVSKVHAGEKKELLLSLEAVHKWHESVKWFKKQRFNVIRDLTFSLYKGDSLGIIGESGSGKSTIAKIILKMWNQNLGTVVYKGKPISRFKNLDREIQLVFQDPYSSLNPKHRIGNAIVEVLKTKINSDNLKAQAEELLETVGLLKSDFHKYPHEFSGGQRQRICIAKALAKSPEILVLDESVSALDVSVQARILNLLNKLKEEKNLTYILISHDMNVISYFCNRIVVLKEGKIVESGDTEKLILQPGSSYTKTLLNHSIN